MSILYMQKYVYMHTHGPCNTCLSFGWFVPYVVKKIFTQKWRKQVKSWRLALKVTFLFGGSEC